MTLAIGAQAFANCKKLTKITVPANVTTIGKKAFYNCKKLKTFTIKSKKLTSVGNKAITGINKKATIKVPKA
ncbi:MAG: leucine-rich repeat domain-containing protein, partial [Clostridiales bacterium]|nr:leucine-rich repeat domain-containing protein [Clostridiales bacterium]